MFNQELMRQMYDDPITQRAMTKLNLLEERLTAKFYSADIPIKALVMATATQTSALFDGPPGVAKSAMVRALCELTNILNPSDGAKAAERELQEVSRGDYFEYLLSAFTEPTELFGSFKLSGITGGGRLERYDAHMIQRCRVVFLDEIFNASSAILNALLALMNERIFHDRGRVVEADLKVLFAATNAQLPPSDTRLSAVYDRFVFRCKVSNLEAEPENFGGLIRCAWNENLEPDSELEDLFEVVATFHRDVFRPRLTNLWSATGDDASLKALSYVVGYAQQYGLGAFSNRRVVQMCEALAVHRLLRANKEGALKTGEIEFEDLRLAWTFFLDVTDALTEDHIAQFHSVFGRLNQSKKS